MGDQYINVNGTWTKVTRPYIKVGGTWLPTKSSYVKRSGVWVQSWQYDTTPSAIPELGLRIIENRFVRVESRLPSTATDPQLRRIRILAMADTSPTSQFGSGYLSGKSSNYPKETFSDWWYNGSNPDAPTADHGDSSVIDYKYYPVNPTSKTNLTGGKWYYFSAWSEDKEGNWSAGNFSRIFMPKDGTAATNVVSREMNVQAVGAGSLDSIFAFTPGAVSAHNTPTTNGAWFYGTQFTESIGKSGSPTITSARIRVTRSNDSGLPLANVRLGWHATGTPGPVDVATFQNTTVLGTIQKGESKWFDLPTTWYTHFNTQIQGVGLRNATTASDDIDLADLGTDIRCGEINIGWNEAL